MSGIYYTDLPDILRGAGVQVGVGSINAGWETRSRSSGGFPSVPLAVFWHHTASKTSVDNDLTWQCHTCPDKPVGNMLIDRTGKVWPVAAGASNCAGKGGPASFSRGTIPQDSGNTRGWQIEVANNGTGEQWPVAQIDAYFASSNALNARFGNDPADVITHHVWAPTRKIDPARAEAVQGPWQPASINSSGTWALDDIRYECSRRAGQGPGPQPPGDDDDMIDGIYRSNLPGATEEFVWYSGGNKYWITDDGMRDGAKALLRWFGKPEETHVVGPGQFAAQGIVLGPVPPGHDQWGNYTG